MATFKIAHLSEEQSRKIQALEEELSVCAIAMEPGLEIAKLSEERLSKVKELEEELGVTLIVYTEC